ncbi:hypothetical protein TSUD_311450 [Trifolium subterraneum]|nr:hypothetical protein TSUD_311450 [Trifolium subterraneum]
MAALDFIVCDESNVFATNNNGNVAKILAGQRRYFGHKPTIRPSSRKASLGEPKEVRPSRGEFHENPSTCICEDSVAKAAKNSDPRKFSKDDGIKKDVANDEVDVDDNDNDNDD